jgi:enamine deaminase RidA (YjgF/YER057c/UK114 family)
MERRAIRPRSPQGWFTQATEVIGAQRVLLCSGQVSLDPDGNLKHPGDMAKQVEAALDNLEAVLREADMDFPNVVRVNYYATDVDALRECLPSAGARITGGGAPVASTVLGITKLARPGLLVEIEATAVA